MTPKLALLEDCALIARAFGAPHRLMLLEQLAQGPRGVEVLAAKIGVSPANASQHLQMLRRAGLVTSNRAGRAMVYRLTDDRTLQVMALLGAIARDNQAVVAGILDGLTQGGLAQDGPPEPVTRADLAEGLAAGSVTLLDLRPEDEFSLGHIPGAIRVDLAALEGLVTELSEPGEIVAYCRGPYCLYAHQAVARLRAIGFAARRLEGGVADWRAEGRPVRVQ